MTDTVRIGADTALRQHLMAESAMSHPAKCPLPLIQLIADRYNLKAGDTVLDIMAGSGSIMVLALQGINVLGAELEHHFLWAQHQSWAKMRQNPMLFCELGTVTMLWGDAKDARTWCLWPYRELAERYRKDSWDVIRARRRKYRLRLAEATPWLGEDVGAVLFSPPYDRTNVSRSESLGEAPFGGPHSQARGQGYTRKLVDSVPFSPPYEGSDVSPGNVGNVIKRELWGQGHSLSPPAGYTRPNAVVVSPPWENELPSCDPKFDDKNQMPPTRKNAGAMNKGYTRPSAILTSPPYEEGLGHGSPTPDPVDVAKSLYNNGQRGYSYTRPPVKAVLTSPPFGEAQTGGEISSASLGEGSYKVTTRIPRPAYDPRVHGQRPENIGNQKGQEYFESMSAVYAQCHDLLQPGSLIVLILKGFTRDGVYQDLPQQTIDLLEAQGWKLHDRWLRELASLSFWRVLQGTDAVSIKVGDQMGLDGEIKELLRVKRENNGRLDPRLRFEHIVSFERML